MDHSHDDRVDSALTQLVEHLLPGTDYEDEAEIEARHDEVLERVHDLINGHRSADSVMDIQHVGDMIRGKLIRDNPTTEQAKKFSSLYTRLLTQSVLAQKWGVLKFLLEVSGQEDNAAAATAVAVRTPDAVLPSAEREAEDEQIFSTAFSGQGLHRLPARGTPQDSGGGSFSTEPDMTGQPTKADLLLKRGDGIEPSEQTLLSALPFTLLGLSSGSLPFKSTTASRYVVSLPPTLPLPLVSLLHTLAEPSLLYKSLDDFVQDPNDGAEGGGLVGQSLRSAIGNELRGYVELVGGLESQIRRAIAAAERGQGILSSGVTLKRCVVWTREATMGLRMMSLIVDKTRGQKGGQLISTIHGFASDHGDPFVRAFAERILAQITRPFYDMLRHWIYEGELTDPYVEFFVTEEAPEPAAQGGDKAGSKANKAEAAAAAVAAAAAAAAIKPGATSVWQDKYHFHAFQVPTIITEGFAKKVFLIGKSLNFIRHGCSESDWVDEYCKSTSKELRYGDTANLEMSIDEAYKTTMARLIDLMDNKFKLYDHLVALKKFLLLGQGDFIALLMESLSNSLDRPANTLYRHNLTAQLEHAIRGSNAQFEKQDILARLDARMLELSHGEVGWDVFTLEYKIEAPVDVVVTAYSSKQYLKLFNFLWRVKRVEYALGSSWRRYMTGARGVLKAVDDIVGPDWKKARCVVAEMVHFVNQLQYYILFEVIESSWGDLILAIKKPNVTLDDLIDAHAEYLRQITHKGLLGGTTTRNGKKRTAADTGDESFLSQLHEILKIMLQYKDVVDGLYGYSVTEFTRRQEHSARIEARTGRGDWGVRETDDDLSSYQDQTLPNLRHRLRSLSSDFSARIVVLLGDLTYQPDADLRLLGVLLSFNEFYPVVHKKSRRERTDRGDVTTQRRTPRTTASSKEKGKEREHGDNASLAAPPTTVSASVDS
ncbi:Spc98 family-domain-containing protein [Tricharina praecox]|uniref:Spc98 family-domain-containing protein n=1 Tax=Tricharina praecox TaxID=43433 RepID=UPI0022209165|nr:Spc98 family-domain-containing protein [Tricharina praecox]KAI5858067.1 Spc98 family-domain-containing protein [Tricharina praecox]